MPKGAPLPAEKILAQELLRERSVSLNPVLRYNKGKAFPHFIPFIRYPYQLGVTDQNNFYQVAAASAEGPDGITVAANGGITDIPVPLDRDMDFHLLWIKYTAHRIIAGDEERSPDEGCRSFLAPPASLFITAGSFFTAQANQMIPYLSFLEASVFLVGAGGRDQYGGLQNNSTTREKELIPQPLHAIQKADDGPGQIRLAAQLPASTTIMIRMRNFYTVDLQVNGVVFGYKV